MVTTTNDADLYVRWLEDRDETAFAEIARRHGGVVYDLAVRSSGDRLLAEDLVQEALLDLAVAGTRKPVEVGIVAWLARFAICRGRNALSSERSRSKRQQIVGERRRENVMPDDRLERDDELEHALTLAEPEERVVLAMRYLHGWDYARIATSLSVSEGAARVRVHRALARLRERLGVNGEKTAARNGSLLSGLAALPMFEAPRGLVDMAVERALSAVSAAAPGAPATAIAARPTRLTLSALGLSALVGVAVTMTAMPGGEPLSMDHDTVEFAAAEVIPPFAATADRNATSPDGDWALRGSPRPPEWDDGVLGRLSEARLSEPRSEAPQRRRVADPSAKNDDVDLGNVEIRRTHSDEAAASAERLVEVPRPTVRDARAATSVTVSFDDERAGTSAGRDPAAPSSDTTARIAIDARPGASAPIPVETTDALPRRRERTATVVTLEELDDEQRELVAEAATLVSEILAIDSTMVTGDALTVDRRELARRSRDLRVQYKRSRKRLRRAAVSENADQFAAESVQMARISSTNRVLSFLLGVVLPDGRRANELVWPDGADVTEALRDVIATLGAVPPAVPDGVSDDVRDEIDGLDLDPSVTAPDTWMPDGAVLPDAIHGADEESSF